MYLPLIGRIEHYDICGFWVWLVIGQWSEDPADVRLDGTWYVNDYPRKGH